MKIIKGIKKLSVLFILSALLFINVMPSFADGNLKYFYDNGNQLLFIEETATGRVIEYQYDESGNRTQKGIFEPSTITVTAGPNGSVSPGSVLIPYKFSQTFTITPAVGYFVQDVVVDGQSKGAVTSYTFDNVTASHTISASFGLPYTITARAGSGGNISPGTIAVAPGFNQTFTITPVDGYVISDVLVDGASVGAVTSYTFSNVTANHSIIAIFVYPTVTDPCTGGTATSVGTDIVRTFTSSGMLSCSSAITVQYLVVAGGGAGGTSYGGGGGAGGYLTGTLSLTAGQKTVIVGSGGVGGAPPTNGGDSTFDTITSTGGGYGGSDYVNNNRLAPHTGGSGGGGIYRTYSAGADSNPVTDPVQGYKGGNSAGSPPYRGGGGGGGGGNGGAGGNQSGAGGPGKVSSISGFPVTYATGGAGKIDADGNGQAGAANTGNGGDGDKDANDFNGSNGGSGIVIVRYMSPTATIMATAGSGGSITPSGAVEVSSGSNQTFTIMPATGYSIADVLVDGVSVGSVTSYTFSNVTVNHTISASFSATYTITATAGSNGNITPSGIVTVNSGTGKSFTITPNSGYAVADVLVDGTSVGAVTSYTFSIITASHTISASFVPAYFTLTVLKGTSDLLTGVNCYTFTEAGAYLGLSGTTNSNGQVTFNLADGNYKFRVDYLGYQFWSDVVTIPTTMSLTKTITHQNVNVTVQGSLAGNLALKAGVPVYLFTSSGSYLSLNKTTDSSGQATFNLPQQAYKVRADYLGQQFWTGMFTWEDKTVVIPEGTARIHVTGAGLDLSNVQVYVFSSGGSYLSINGTTDASGIKEFRLPAGSYKFRVDYQGSQYWATATLSQDVVNTIELSTGGGQFTFIIDTGSGPLTGVKVYLFNSTGSYLNVNATSDTAGKVTFNLADGNYKFRVDYLGYQFWSDVVTVPTTLSLIKTITHQNVSVTVQGSLADNLALRAGVPVYLFTSSGSYLSLNSTTNSSGRVTFNLTQQAYKVRADYLGQQYWSDVFTWEDKTIVIPEGIARIHVTNAGLDLSNVPVYVFSAGGSYLTINGTTDTSGIKEFRLPAGSYKFRTDYQGNQYWATAAISQDVVNTVELSTGGGKFILTIDKGSGPLTGVKVYLFNSTGLYLSVNATSDAAGQVTFNLADGNYKFRVDYLGYQFWTDVYAVPTNFADNFSIPQQNVTITVEGVYQGSQPLAGVSVYLFTPSGSYLSANQTTNSSGQVTFSLPNKSYKVRADYLGSQFWSDEFQFTNATVNIQRGIAQITAKKAGNPMTGLKIYLFSESGSYLGLNATTNAEGKAEFLLPNRSYKFRVDEGSTQHWSSVTAIIEGQVNPIEVNWN